MINNKKSILVDGYWVVRTNKWDAKIYTQEQADYSSKLLSNCIDCVNCISCSYCRGCSNCYYCHNCISCHNCIFCNYCDSCRSCSYCTYCHYCRDFKTNPQSITSPNIGSQNEQTTFYWNDEKEQIVRGCFVGNLEEFESKIKETHGDNEHAQDYFKWIEKIKFYKKTNKQ
jgi:hypothetical protein